MSICTQCHEMASARQRVYWFLQRVVMGQLEEVQRERDGSPLAQPTERDDSRIA